MEYLGEIVEIREETYDVKTFRLKLDKTIKYIPGQYFLAYIGSESRPFTFSNIPEKDYIEFTVKKLGTFTAKLHSLKAGDNVNIEGPFGEKLNFDESITDDVVFIAGGSGITPFMSAIRYAVNKRLKNKFYLFFSNKTEKDIIYYKELEKIRRISNIKVIKTLTDNVPDGWKGETGRINRQMIERYVSEPKDKLWYLCGPPPMIKAIKQILLEMNIPEKRLRVEDWQIPGKHDMP